MINTNKNRKKWIGTDHEVNNTTVFLASKRLGPLWHDLLFSTNKSYDMKELLKEN